jgi:hypothetical protein
MREFLESVHIFSMKPHNDLLSQRMTNEAYCLAESGEQYAVFFTGDSDGRLGIDLTDSGRLFELRWLDITTSRWDERTTISSNRNYMLKAPENGLCVAVLTVSEP